MKSKALCIILAYKSGASHQLSLSSLEVGCSQKFLKRGAEHLSGLDSHWQQQALLTDNLQNYQEMFA